MKKLMLALARGSGAVAGRRPPQAAGQAEGLLRLCRPDRRFRLVATSTTRAAWRSRRRSATRSRPPTSKTCRKARTPSAPSSGSPAPAASIIFTHVVRLHGPDAEGRRQVPGREVRACHRLQDGRQRGDLQCALLRRPLRASARSPPRCRRAGVAGYIASFPIPEVVMGINSFMLGAQSVNPGLQAQGRLGEHLVRPGQGSRRRQGADRPGRRHHHPAHRFDRRRCRSPKSAASRPSARRPT